jgi:beta-mannosidase
MLAERWGWEYDPNDQEGPWDKTQFPAREIYERVQPEICERLAGDVPYWRSSPYGGKTSNDLTVGDTHIWDGSYLPWVSLWNMLTSHSMARQDVAVSRL